MTWGWVKLGVMLILQWTNPLRDAISVYFTVHKQYFINWHNNVTYSYPIHCIKLLYLYYFYLLFLIKLQIFFAMCLFITCTVYFRPLNVCCNHAVIYFPAEITFCVRRHKQWLTAELHFKCTFDVILKPVLKKEGIKLYLLDHKHLRGSPLAMPLCQKHGVIWIRTQRKDGGASTNNESHSIPILPSQNQHSVLSKKLRWPWQASPRQPSPVSIHVL